VSLVIQTGDFGNAAQQNASGSIIFVGKDGGATNRAGSIVSKPYTNQDLIFSSSQSHSDIRFSVLDGSDRYNLLTLTSGRSGGGLTAHRGPKVFIADTAAGYNRSVNLDGRGAGLLSISTQTDQLALEIVHTGSSSENALEIKTLVGGTNSSNNLFSVGASETVINDGSADHDFRVESDSETNMFYVDGTNNRVGIACNAPMATLDINNRAATNWSIIFRNADGSGPATTYAGLKTNNNGVLIVTGTNGKLFLNAGKHSTNENAEFFLAAKTGLDGGSHGQSRIWFSKMAANEAMTQFAYMGYDHVGGTIKMGGSSTWGSSEWISANSSEVVINDDSGDINFRVESNDKTNALFIDGTNGKVQIGDDTTSGLGNYANLTVSRTTTGSPWDSYDTSANQIDEMSLFLRNQSDTERSFAGVGFGVGTEIDVDSIGAAIIAERDGTAHATSTKHDTNLIFATNYAGDDTLHETLRLAHDGKIYASRLDNPGSLTFVRKDSTTLTGDGLGEILFTATESTEGIHHDIISGSMIGGCAIGAYSNYTWSSSNGGAYLTFSTTTTTEEAVTERLRITDDGKIGISATTPRNKLQVNVDGSDGNDGVMIVRVDSSTSDGDLLGGIGFDSTDGNYPSSITEASCFIAAYAAEAHAVGDKGGDLVFGTTTINDDDDTTSHEWMRILDSGNVGIGINAPQSKLHIEHTDTTTWPYTDPAAVSDESYSNFLLTLRNNTDTQHAFAGVAFDVTSETDADSIGAAIAAVSDNTTSTAHDSNLVFATNDGGDDGLTERMRITHDGYIGMGPACPTAPDEALHVDAGAATTRIRIETDDGYDCLVAGYQATTQKFGMGYDDSADLVSLSYGSMGNHHIQINATGQVELDAGADTKLTLRCDSETDSDEAELAFVHEDGTMADNANFGSITWYADEGNDRMAGRLRMRARGSMSDSDSEGEMRFSCTPVSSVSSALSAYITNGDNNMLYLDGDVSSDAFHTEGHQYIEEGTDIDYGDACVLSNGKMQRSSSPKQKNVCGIAWRKISLRKKDLGFAEELHNVDGDGVETPKTWRDSLGVACDRGKKVGDEWVEGDNYASLWKVASIGDSRELNGDGGRSSQPDLLGFKVCDEGGVIEAGDLLCTSSTPGYLMKQDDDLIHSYTVGKAMEAVTFDDSGLATGIYGYVYCG
jgi:hypothetical protein